MFKRVLFTFVLLFLSIGIWAQEDRPAEQPWLVNQPWWFTLEIGKLHFSNGSYGDALMAFEDARRSRYSHFSRMEDELIIFLSIPEVRRLGDSLDFIEWYVSEQNETRISNILLEIYHYFPKTGLGSSVSNALDALDTLKTYPEAEFWLGECFRVEGELNLALRQYERALSGRELFLTPDFDLEISYRLFDLHNLRGDYNEMERRGREILDGNDSTGSPRDFLWSQNLMRAAMIRMLETGGIDRFLMFYRHDNIPTERAHRELGFYLYTRGRYITALDNLMFAFLIQNTIIINEILRRDFDYVYTDLGDLMTMIGTRRDLLSFMEEIEYFKTIYYFASTLHANGKTIPAQELWDFLATSLIAGEWGERARRSGTPFVESVVVLP